MTHADEKASETESPPVYLIGVGETATTAVGRLARHVTGEVIPVGVCSNEPLLERQAGIRRLLVGPRGGALGGGCSFGEAVERIASHCEEHLVVLAAHLGDPSTSDAIAAVGQVLKRVAPVTGIFSQPLDECGQGNLRFRSGTYASWNIVSGPREPSDECLYWGCRAVLALARNGRSESDWLNYEALGLISIARSRDTAAASPEEASVEMYRRACSQISRMHFDRAQRAGYWQLAPSNAPASEHSAMTARLRRMLKAANSRVHVACDFSPLGSDAWTVLFVPEELRWEPEPEASESHEYETKVRVIGLGSIGVAAVKSAVERGLAKEVALLVDTDGEALNRKRGQDLSALTVGYETCRLKGTGGDEEMARKAASEDEGRLRYNIYGRDLVVVVAGLGGGTGSGIAPVLAEWASGYGALTIAVVAENAMTGSPRRAMLAARALEQLQSRADCVLVANAAGLRELVNNGNRSRSIETEEIELLADGVLSLVQPVLAAGLVGFDFADMQTIFRRSGWARIGVGWAGGERRATRAAKTAVSSATLGALAESSGVQILISAGVDVRLDELEEAASVVYEEAPETANTIWQAVLSEKLEGIEVTVVATGMPAPMAPRDALPMVEAKEDS